MRWHPPGVWHRPERPSRGKSDEGAVDGERCGRRMGRAQSRTTVGAGGGEEGVSGVVVGHVLEWC